MKALVLVVLVAVVFLEGCGGGGGGGESLPPVARPVVEPPVLVVPPPSVVVPPPSVVEPVDPAPPVVGLTQMARPSSCDTVASATGLTDFPFITCDGVPTSGDVSYPYDEGNTDLALITVYAVVDTKLDTGKMTVDEWVAKQIDYANNIYVDSGVFIVLQVAGIKMVDVRSGDLLGQ